MHLYNILLPFGTHTPIQLFINIILYIAIIFLIIFLPIYYVFDNNISSANEQLLKKEFITILANRQNALNAVINKTKEQISELTQIDDAILYLEGNINNLAPPPA